MSECDHGKIQVIRRGRSYVWSCALCGKEMVRWEKIVWEAVMSNFVGALESEHLAEGEGFTFRITERGMEREGTKELVA